MPPTPNPIDLTILAAVKLWASVGLRSNQPFTIPASTPFTLETNAQTNVSVSYAGGAELTEVDTAPSEGQYAFENGTYFFAAADAGEAIAVSFLAATDDDQTLQDCITAFSSYVLHLTGRGPTDGSIPTESPFVQPVAYDEFYDGSGTNRQPIRNWPIQSVAAVNVNGQAIQQSTSINVWGWVVDQDKKFISIRGGYSPSVATFQNYRYQGGRYGTVQGPGFCAGVQNVEIQYTAGFNGVPFDLEMVARKVVSLNYKRRGWIGLRTQAMAAGAGTVTYGQWEWDDQDRRTVMYYQRRVA